MLAQWLRIVHAARLRAELIARHGESGAFPSPQTLARLDLDLPGRKSEYLRHVAEAALDGLLDGAALRAPDAPPSHERRLGAEIDERHGPDRTLAEVSQARRPYPTWAAVHLRAPREQRTGEIAGH